MGESYLNGTDILGASSDGQAVVIRVKDPGSVVKAKGGAAGDLAFMFLPQTITNKVYDDMAAQIRKALAAEKVDADVQVVNLPVGASASGSLRGRSDFLPGAITGVAAVSVGWALWRFLLRGLILGRSK